MSTNEVDATARTAPSPRTGGLRRFADRWPFRRKLNLLVGIPLALVAALLAHLFAEQVDTSQDAADAARLVRDSAQVAELVDRVEAEHQQAILLSVRFEATGAGRTPSTAGYRAAQKAVDAQVEKVSGTFGDRLPETEAQALREILGLGSLRATVEQGYLPANNIDPAYTNAAKGLIDGLGLDRNEALAATFTGNLLDSLLRAAGAHSAFETSVLSARTGDTNALIEYNSAVASYALYTAQADRFARFATEAQADELGRIEHNTAQASIIQHYAELQLDPGGLQATTPAQVRRAFSAALAAYPVYHEQSRTRLRITASLIDQIADRAEDTSDDASWRAGLLLTLGLLGFTVWIAFSVLVRRSVVRPVQALTGAAREVADVAGRELARVADDDAEDAGPPKLREMPVTARDEIGELAEVFNRVQTTAVALLERQVLSRRNVAEMFGNVGRRVSNLTTRQLALIDAVERDETDPALLERLYSIDHIAVRLRRNADSLMLLAGIRETVLDSGPTELTNVVRAALGQIEGFQRVRLRARTEAMVEPDLIGDLTLMVAELLENAVSFSPAGNPVEVFVRDSSGADPAGASIVISDHGLGMSAERLAEENARLVRRERLDVMPTKVLGLFVVGTLARRWGVGVLLSRTPGGGVTAEVTVPSSLLLTMSPPAADASGSGTGPALPPTGTRPAPESSGPWPTASAETSGRRPAAAESARPAATAAETSGPLPTASAETSGPRPAAESVRPAAAESVRPAAAESVRPAAAESVRPAAAAAGTADAGQPEPLPRRLPRREPAHAAGTAETAGTAGTADAAGTARPPSGGVPFIPRARSGTTSPETTPSPAPSGDGTARPLRRRMRGATLRTTADPDRQAARQAPRPADAEAVRAALDEFEAAVERANRDCGTHPTTSGPDHQNDLPEGAEQ
ncbi:ATP-binding protein [Streptomyces sp. NPDC000987]|uniref:sensor histidine kinase n=1 Tax=Streptomyces sp. NPDC000987 TaxID=3154374 RepID=UPI00332E4F23